MQIIHTISASPRDSQDDKVLTEHDKFNIQVSLFHNIQIIDQNEE